MCSIHWRMNNLANFFENWPKVKKRQRVPQGEDCYGWKFECCIPMHCVNVLYNRVNAMLKKGQEMAMTVRKPRLVVLHLISAYICEAEWRSGNFLGP